MAKCTQTSGSYRCMFDVGHAGPCEAQAPEYHPGDRLLHELKYRIETLEAQVKSLQMAMPKGLPR